MTVTVEWGDEQYTTDGVTWTGGRPEMAAILNRMPDGPPGYWPDPAVRMAEQARLLYGVRILSVDGEPPPLPESPAVP